MKISVIAKTAAILLAASTTLALASCGDSSSSSKSDNSSSSKAAASSSESAEPETEEITEEQTEESAELTGAEQTWGIYTVMVPDGWTLKGGDYFDENDPDVCAVKKSDFSYFEFKSETESTQKQQYEYNKSNYTNEQTDIPATMVGDIEWTGFQYGNDFGGGFELYAQAEGKFLRVSCAGFKFDSPEAEFVLSSLKVSKG